MAKEGYRHNWTRAPFLTGPGGMEIWLCHRCGLMDGIPTRPEKENRLCFPGIHEARSRRQIELGIVS
jgi:hypothetical protein